MECRVFLNDGNIMVGSKISSSDQQIILDTEIASLDFKKLVEKIKKQNITKPYPNISIIER